MYKDTPRGHPGETTPGQHRTALQVDRRSRLQNSLSQNFVCEKILVIVCSG